MRTFIVYGIAKFIYCSQGYEMNIIMAKRYNFMCVVTNPCIYYNAWLLIRILDISAFIKFNVLILWPLSISDQVLGAMSVDLG